MEIVGQTEHCSSRFSKVSPFAICCTLFVAIFIVFARIYLRMYNF